ncbi:DNA damage-inducible protein 1-like protein [Tanacetum coccineum]
MVKLNARCSVVLQNELPPNEKDPGSFVLPCIIGNTTVSNALADLRASISVMWFSMFKRLGLGNPRSINMVIEMADRSTQSPKGIDENALVKVLKFIFSVDFVILDIVEDNEVPIILGRSMMATSHARIDDNNLFPYYEDPGDNPPSLNKSPSRNWNPVEEFQDSDDNLDYMQNRELVYTGNNVVGKAKNLQVFIGCYSFLTDFIILENVNEFFEKGLAKVIFCKPFKEEIGLEEDISKGIIWFKIRDDKKIFNMPRAEKRLSKLTTEQQNLMSPILKISDEDKAKGIRHPYQKIKEFYKDCLNLGEEYKPDLEVIDWIKRAHASVHKLR